MKVIFLFLFLVCLLRVNAQTFQKLSRSNLFAIGFSRFNVHEAETEDYLTQELRVGHNIEYRFADKWSLRSGVNLGVKFKRKPYLTPANLYYGRGIRFPHVDQTASERTHFALSIPISIRYTFRNTLAIDGGLMGRGWAPTDLVQDILNLQAEYGLLFGISKKVKNKIWIGVDAYSMFRPFHAFETQNQFIQLKVDLILAPKSHRFK